jgi:hypothetical protein
VPNCWWHRLSRLSVGGRFSSGVGAVRGPGGAIAGSTSGVDANAEARSGGGRLSDVIHAASRRQGSDRRPAPQCRLAGRLCSSRRRGSGVHAMVGEGSPLAYRVSELLQHKAGRLGGRAVFVNLVGVDHEAGADAVKEVFE